MKRIILIAALASMTLCMQAQLLWKVSGNGLEKDSYIFGTMHIAPTSFIDQVSGLNDALGRCDVLVTEVSGSDHQTGNPMAFFASYNSALDRILSSEDYNIVKKEFDDYFGEEVTALEQIKQFTPAFIDVLMWYGFSLEVFPDAKIGEGIEDGLEARAEALGIAMEGFERTQEQYDMFAAASKSIQEQALALAEACRKGGYLKKMHDLTIAECKSYLNQELQYHYDDGGNEDAELIGDESNEILQNGRNRRWVGQLITMMPERSCLVAVGRAHLRGDEGLLQLLRNEGYTVEPVL